MGKKYLYSILNILSESKIYNIYFYSKGCFTGLHLSLTTSWLAGPTDTTPQSST